MLLCITFAMVFDLVGCQKQQTEKQRQSTKEKTAIAISKPQIQYLYFKGNLHPIKTTVVKSTVDGRISDIYAVYGEQVTKGFKLAAIKPIGLEEKFRSSVTDFLQRKSSLEQQRNTFQGDQELYKAGVMSQESFNNSRNSYNTAVLNLSQSSYQLRKVLKKVGLSLKEIEKLSLTNTKQVTQLLSRSLDDSIVRAPVAGIVLIPKALKSEASGSSKEDGSTIAVGNNIAELQPMFSIGDPSGYMVDININEVNIAEIKKGLKAVVTGEAFPGITLHGVIDSVAVQASPSDSGAFSLYAATVRVPNVSKAQRKDIRLGMTVKVQVQIKKPARIMVPIKAVFTQQGETYVTLVEPAKRHDIPVETGSTDRNNVSIIRGLHKGDKVVVYPEGHQNDTTKTE